MKAFVKIVPFINLTLMKIELNFKRALYLDIILKILLFHLFRPITYVRLL